MRWNVELAFLILACWNATCFDLAAVGQMRCLISNGIPDSEYRRQYELRFCNRMAESDERTNELETSQEIEMSVRDEPRADAMDSARHHLCHQLVQAIREGELGLQVRFIQLSPAGSAAWIYTRREHEWKKRDDLAVADSLAEPLHDLMEGLFHQSFSDAWTCHRTEHSDRIDFDLKFHRESIEPHVKGNLESYLNGCLSHAHHDSGRDSRHRMGFRGHRS